MYQIKFYNSIVKWRKPYLNNWLEKGYYSVAFLAYNSNILKYFWLIFWGYLDLIQIYKIYVERFFVYRLEKLLRGFYRFTKQRVFGILPFINSLIQNMMIAVMQMLAKFKWNKPLMKSIWFKTFFYYTRCYDNYLYISFSTSKIFLPL